MFSNVFKVHIIFYLGIRKVQHLFLLLSLPSSTAAEAETPVLWPPHAKSWLIRKDSDAGRDWGQEEEGTTGWDGWMASPTRWMWVWVNSRRWWWTGRPGVLWFMESQSWTWLSDWTELNWTETLIWASQVAQCWRIHLPMQEMWVQSLGREDPLEKEMVIHSSILAWVIPWTEDPGGAIVYRVAKS